MRSVGYIFRHPRPGFHSIENVFNAIIPYVEKKFRVERIYMPYGNVSLKGVTANFRALKNAPQTDIQHFTGHDHYLAINALTKSVLSIHDTGSALTGSFLRRKIMSRYWFQLPVKKADAVTTISGFSASEITSLFPESKEKLHHIPNPVDNHFTFHPKTFQPERPRILQVGVKPNKNLERTATALAGIPCLLIILGEPSEKQKSLLSELNINYEVKSGLQINQVAELYNSCDILSFVSTYEGFGMPVLEAQATGRPVLASDIKAVKEVAGDSVLYANPFHVPSIKEGIRQLIGSEQTRKMLINKGLDNVKKFRAEKIAQQYMMLYNQLLNE